MLCPLHSITNKQQYWKLDMEIQAESMTQLEESCSCESTPYVVSHKNQRTKRTKVCP